MIISKDRLPVFIYESEAYSGVRRIADYVRRDMLLVFGEEPSMLEIPDDNFIYEIMQNEKGAVVFGTLGKSPAADRLIADGEINVDSIRGKREAYIFNIINNVILIIGSDKRGTIYGLFHLSKILGVSPFVDWSDLKPKKLEELELTSTVNYAAKEPSVKYRGFFINDEWPAFGSFAAKRFGGINARLYEVIFTMLLRMNGNYLWPAMWASCFALDGPGLDSAVLADELGVVMGLSHHEPCLRHGEEYSQLRGPDSVYGDAWNFIENREGITRFWRDGLKRNGHLENVITIGMRGERDSTIMEKDSSLSDNIELLRDVITTQNELIREEVNPDLEQVPRLFALYKEVEPFYFGDKETKGLIDDECLDDVILLLCDDNHGYLRSRPDSASKHYGLYYHFDYHGEPVSYEWVNSTYLPEVWEELTEAYETGIRDLFIVNVGDVGFNEFALNYFLDFAYDYDKWGIKNINGTAEYTRQWFDFNFAHSFSKGCEDGSAETGLHNSDIALLAKIWTKACRLNHRRRPEHMNADVYPPEDFTAALDILNITGEIISTIDGLENKCIANKDAFIQLIGYQTKASMNLIRMWIYKGLNRFAAQRNMYITGFFADRLEETFAYDEKLTRWLHEINSGKYYGLALASHIGFKHWNDEESAYPSVERIYHRDKTGIIAGVEGSEQFTAGLEWSGKKLAITDKSKCSFFIALCGQRDTEYRIECDSDSIAVSDTGGMLTKSNPFKIVTVSLHNLDAADNASFPVIHILSENSDIEIEVRVSEDESFFFDSASYIEKYENENEKIIKLNDIGNTTNGVKLYAGRAVDLEAPSYLAYDFYVSEESIYKIRFNFLPCSPRKAGDNIYFGLSLNSTDTKDIRVNKVLSGLYKPGASRDWADGVIRHERCVECLAGMKMGTNRLYYYPYQEENLLLYITLTRVMAVQ